MSDTKYPEFMTPHIRNFYESNQYTLQETPHTSKVLYY